MSATLTPNKFADVPARQLLAAAIREERAPERGGHGLYALKAEPEGGSLVADLAAASEETHAALEGKGLTLSVDEASIVDIHESIFAGTGEIYVVTSVISGAGTEPDFQTHVFPRISWGERLPLDDGGMLIGKVANPRWFVDFHVLVMESDSDIRKVGEALGELKESTGLNDALKLAGNLAHFDPTGISTITSAVGLVMSGLAAALKKNGDDNVATFHNYYLAAQGFGEGRHPEQGTTLWQDARIAYRIDVTDM